MFCYSEKACKSTTIIPYTQIFPHFLQFLLTFVAVTFDFCNGYLESGSSLPHFVSAKLENLIYSYRSLEFFLMMLALIVQNFSWEGDENVSHGEKSEIEIWLPRGSMAETTCLLNPVLLPYQTLSYTISKPPFG